MSPIYTKGVVGVHRCAVLCTRTFLKKNCNNFFFFCSMSQLDLIKQDYLTYN